MSVSAITDQIPALQQRLARARARVELAHGAVPEAVAVELVPVWSLFRGVRGAIGRGRLGVADCPLAARKAPVEGGRRVARGPIGMRGSPTHPMRGSPTHPSALLQTNETCGRTVNTGQA